jgi:ABC-type branched-subunit amino acid transport system substrate-binding protein
MKQSLAFRSLVTLGIAIISLLLVNPTASYAKPVAQEWDIPFLVFRTGPYAAFGQIIEWCTERGVEDANSKGGPQGIPLSVKYYDTALDATKAVSELSKVVEKSLVIWGPIAAHEVKASNPLAVRNKVLLVSPACGYDVSVLFKPWQLHLWARFEDIVPGPMKGWVQRNPGMKSVVQLVWPNDPTWMEAAKIQRKALEDLGIKVMPDVECSEGIDMGSAVVKAMAGSPDGYVITVGPTEAGKIVLELNKRGVKDKGKIMIFHTAAGPALFEIAGGALNGAYHYYSINVDSKKPRFQELSKQFEEKFKMQPTFDLPIFYDMVSLTAEAIAKTGVTGDPAKRAEERVKMRDFMRDYKGYKGLAEDYDIVDGAARIPGYLYQFQNGRKVLIESFFPK